MKREKLEHIYVKEVIHQLDDMSLYAGELVHRQLKQKNLTKKELIKMIDELNPNLLKDDN